MPGPSDELVGEPGTTTDEAGVAIEVGAGAGTAVEGAGTTA